MREPLKTEVLIIKDVTEIESKTVCLHENENDHDKTLVDSVVAQDRLLSEEQVLMETMRAIYKTFEVKSLRNHLIALGVVTSNYC